MDFAKLDGDQIQQIIKDQGIEVIETLVEEGVDFTKLTGDDICDIVSAQGIEVIQPLVEARVNFAKLTGSDIIEIVRAEGIEVIQPLVKEGVKLSGKATGDIIKEYGDKGVLKLLNNGNDLTKVLFYAQKFNLAAETINYVKFLADISEDKVLNDNNIETYFAYAEKIKQIFGEYNPKEVFFDNNKFLIKPMCNEYESEAIVIKRINSEFNKQDGTLIMHGGHLYDQNC